MAKFIRPQSINFRAEVTEEELRARLAEEVMESIGALDVDGKPLPGVVANVKRGEGRKGGYTIDISGPMPARIYLPTNWRIADDPSTVGWSELCLLD